MGDYSPCVYSHTVSSGPGYIIDRERERKKRDALEKDKDGRNLTHVQEKIAKHLEAERERDLEYWRRIVQRGRGR